MIKIQIRTFKRANLDLGHRRQNGEKDSQDEQPAEKTRIVVLSFLRKKKNE